MAEVAVSEVTILRKQGSTWAQCLASDAINTGFTSGRVGAYKEGSTYYLQRMHFTVDTSFSYAQRYFFEALKLELYFNMPSTRFSTTENYFAIVTQNSLNWTSYSSPTGNFSTLRELNLKNVRYMAYSGSLMSALGSGPNTLCYDLDNPTKFGLWLKDEIAPTGLYDRCIYVDSIYAEFEGSNLSSYDLSFFIIDTSAIGSATIGPHTESSLKTNNKYGMS